MQDTFCLTINEQNVDSEIVLIYVSHIGHYELFIMLSPKGI